MGKKIDSPLQRLLECYVLQAIDELGPKQRRLLERLEGTLQKLYQSVGNWQQIVQQQVGLPQDVDHTLQQAWASAGSDRCSESFAREWAHRLVPLSARCP
ncbi:hypothetical protein [Isoalcanivorax beigongshangi]|uniref:Uncharacterized protein n=1 Tax=Isoalcanivorax beigongshangi TaxID=3238810 RepID=A0ABV4AFA7_9GAMM